MMITSSLNSKNVNNSNTLTLNFTKMHGAGNDFVVLNAIKGLPDLTAEHYRHLANRHFGVGCDQILIIGVPCDAANDFAYRIVNADGSEVEQCGNGARCFMRFVRDQKLTHKTSVRVETARTVIVLTELEDGTIEVNMGMPRFDPVSLPFNNDGLTINQQFLNGFKVYEVPTFNKPYPYFNFNKPYLIGTVSMGNPHAVLNMGYMNELDWVQYPVQAVGELIETHRAFPNRVNVGFMRVINKHAIDLRVWERGAGETLACGTGACAAVVVGIQMGLLESPVQVQAKGGRLTIAWDGTGTGAVMMRGDAQTVFTGQITLPIKYESSRLF